MARVRKLPALPRDNNTTPPEKSPVVKRVLPDGQYALPLAEMPPVTRPLSATPAERLWFAVYLPALPLEAVAVEGSVCAVVEEQQGVHRIVQAEAAAMQAGVMPGQTSHSALALLPELHLEVRSEIREQQTLETLAAWLEQYSSFVSMAGPDLLLLEIAGSLKLFGGLQALRQQIAEGLNTLGFGVYLAIAPTPLAATWLARAGQRACIRDTRNILPAIRELKLDCLEWPPSSCELLQGIGVSTVGECLRLPRDGFAKRVGVKHLLELDRAVGRLPDPRDSWRAPERFCADFEMTEEQSDRDLLQHICEELLRTHERFLLKRQLGTQRLLFSFYHLKAPATQLKLGSASPNRSAHHWADLLRIRFEGLSIPEPVIAVRLRGGFARALSVETGELTFLQDVREGPRYSMAQLAERLVARIGRQSVQGVALADDHRPQFAARYHDVLGTGADKQAFGRLLFRRPLWMLPEPQPLTVEQGHPLCGGRLRLVEGPERLETGWWDEHAMTRDYYLASNPAGRRLWVFRSRRQGDGWYLHGLFG